MLRVSDHHHQMLQCQPRPSLDMDRLCWSSTTSNSGGGGGSKVVVAPNCPRCASSNTKFCYYNNYSLSQPRYFCKACRRYWTRGGSLRNVPVGGGCRKSRRRAPRQQPPTRSFSPDFPTTTEPSSSSSDYYSPNRPTTTASTDIDVAAVFANFFNHHDDSAGTSSSSTEFVGALADESSNPFLDFAQHVGDTDDDHQFIMVGIPPQIEEQQQQIGELVMGNDPNYCLGGLETMMISDEELLLPPAADLTTTVWSEDDSNPPNFGWEQMGMGHFQELPGQVLSTSDDRFNVSPNVISDNNWNLFDLSSSYEIFSRP